MYSLDRKLRILKTRLKKWDKNCFGLIMVKRNEAEEMLQDIQIDIENHSQPDFLQEEKRKAKANLDVSLNLEEEFWKDKGRLNWNLFCYRNIKSSYTCKNQKQNKVDLFFEDQILNSD